MKIKFNVSIDAQSLQDEDVIRLQYEIDNFIMSLSKKHNWKVTRLGDMKYL